MGVFDDKKFEQLDWMTQVTETIDSELNGLLARLPDEKIFDAETLLSVLDHHYSLSISSGNLVRKMISDLRDENINLSSDEMGRIEECFAFQGSETVRIDFEAKTMIGELCLVKVTKTIEDEDLQKMMGSKGLNALRHGIYSEDACARANEILELIDAPRDAMRTRTIRKKVRAVHDRLKTVFLNNEWRIRDMDLADKISYWAAMYIKSGTLAGMVNLCKIKVMTHNTMPIYSIEEEI